MNISRLRLIIQIIAFIILVYGGLFAVNLGSNLPTFACPYVGTRGGGCFLMKLQRLFELPFADYWGYWGINVGIAFAVFLGLFAVFHKSWCGWVCPLGLIQDVITMIRKAFNIRNSVFSWNLHDRLKIIKYGFLGLMTTIPMGIGNRFCNGQCGTHPDLYLPFCQICPAKPLMPMFTGNFSHIGINMSNYVTIIMSSFSMIVLGVFLVGAFYKERFFCSYCPMSALMSLLKKIGFIGLKKNNKKCTSCGICARVCPMDIREVFLEDKNENVLAQDCMLCLKCIEYCPEDGALNATFLRKNFFASSRKGLFKRQNG